MPYGANSSRALRPEQLRVNTTDHPDWQSGSGRTPQQGSNVLCTAGLAEVVRVLGKTGDGSRLLELRLLDGKHPPFFATASNILLPPDELSTRLLR